MNEWLKSFLQEGTADTFDNLVQTYGTDAVLYPLMEKYPTLSDQGMLADRLSGATSLQRKSGPVRTIATFYYCANNGGIERVLCHLISLWVQLGYRVILLTDLPATADDYSIPEDVHRYILPETFGMTPETRLERFRQMQQILKDEEADVLVHHAWLSRNLLWDMLAAKTLHIPFVQYVHGIFSCLETEGNPSDMDMLWALSKIYGLADCVVSLSRTCDEFWHHFNSNTKCFLNPCLAPRPAEIKKDPWQLLWVGRIAPEKRPLDAVRILHLVRQTCPQAHLTILGNAPVYHDLEKEMVQLIAELHEEDSITLAGFQPDPARYYQGSAVLLNTSAYEGFPMVVAEAKTYGIPCVMYDLPYLYFAEEKKGLLSVPHGALQQAADAIVEVLQTPKKWAVLSREALNSSEDFQDEAIARAWCSLFGELEQPETIAESQSPVSDMAWTTFLDHLHTGLDIVDKRQKEYQTDLAELQQRIYAEQHAMYEQGQELARTQTELMQTQQKLLIAEDRARPFWTLRKIKRKLFH